MAEDLSIKTFTLTLGQVGGYIFTLIVPIILVRVLSQSDFGLYRQFWLLLGTFAPLFSMWMPRSLLYFFPRSKEVDKKHLVNQTFVFLLGMGLLSSVLLLVFRKFIGSFFDKGLEMLIIPLAIFSFLTISSKLIDTLFLAEKKIKLAAWITILLSFLQAAFVSVCALLTREVRLIIYAVVAFGVAKFLIILIYSIKNYGVNFRMPKLNLFKNQAAYAFPLGMGAIIYFFNVHLDKYFITYFYSVSDFAVYSVGTFQIPIVNMLRLSIAGVLLPELSQCHKENKLEKMRSLWHEAIRKLGMITVPIFVYFLAVAVPFITLVFTEQYSRSVIIFSIYLFLLWRTIGLFSQPLMAAGESKYILRADIIALVLNLCLSFILIKKIGFIGPAIATVFAMYVYNGLLLLRARRVLGCSLYKSFPWVTLLKILGAAVLPGIISFIFIKEIILPKIFLLIFSFLIFSTLYTTIMLATKQVTKNDRKIIRKLVIKGLSFVPFLRISQK